MTTAYTLPELATALRRVRARLGYCAASAHKDIALRRVCEGLAHVKAGERDSGIAALNVARLVLDHAEAVRYPSSSLLRKREQWDMQGR
jgi:hypothetical protein